jgi:ATP-binding cassette subfamily F protein 3
VDHAYGDLVVYRGLNFEAERGQRTVLVGPNGAGKSTLLKILAACCRCRAASGSPGTMSRRLLFPAARGDAESPPHVLESTLDSPNPVPEQTARTVLGSFLFRGDDVFKPVGVLSGGEKSRLALVKLLLDPPNLLLMDEPTTHLDIGSIDALIGALEQYEGTLIFISHDVHFIRAIARRCCTSAPGSSRRMRAITSITWIKAAPLPSAPRSPQAKVCTMRSPPRPQQQLRAPAWACASRRR